MNDVFANAQRARFGQSSEKNTYVLQKQLGLLNEAEREQNHKAAEPTEETFTVNAHQRSMKRGLGELTQNLLVKEGEFILPKSKSEFTVTNLAAIGELEDAYALYENAAALYLDSIQAYRAAHPNGIPDINLICRKEFRELVNNYYNSHLYLFTSEYRNLYTTTEILFHLAPLYLTPSREAPTTLVLKRHTFAHFLQSLELGAAIKIHNRKKYERDCLSIEEILALIDARITRFVAISEVPAPFETSQKTSTELIIYHSLNTISCRIKGHEIVPGKKVVSLVANPKQSISLPIHICKRCHKEFIGEQTYRVFTKEYGRLLIKPSADCTNGSLEYDCFPPESKLHMLGYNVREGELSENERQLLLLRLLNNNCISYFEACRDIEQAIRLFSGRPKYENSILKWKKDLKFLGDYIKENPDL